MSTGGLPGSTQPRRPLESTQPGGAPVSPTRPRSLRWLAAPALFLGFVGVGVLTGYQAGARLASAAQSQDEAASIQEQFDLGVQDLLAARYELARQRFEYILSLDPAYPGAQELLDRALQGMNAPTGTPTLAVPSPTPRPTLDLSSLEGIYQQAVAAHSVSDWTGTIEALLAMRRIDPAFRLADVNVLMASALRNRGLEEIFAGAREQGIYDLALAERFGPLDSQASSWRNTAAFYSYANSYFGLDWGMAADLFGQVCRAGVWDSCSKYATAAHKFGDTLMLTPDPCGASVWYARSLDTRPDSGLDPTATEAAALCLTATFNPPTGTPTLTPTVTETFPAVPTDTETPTSAPSDTPTPTETPTP